MKKKLRKITKGRPIVAKDLFKLKLPTSVSISPDESNVAYIVERIDEEKNKYFSNLFIYDLTKNRTLQYTFGDHNDSLPVWSHDNKSIAFISTRDKKTGIYIIPISGGAEKKIIELDGLITNMNWTPDNSQLVFCLRYNDSHFIKDEKKKKDQPVYRHITRLFFRLDGLGYRPKDKFQIYKLNIKSGKLTKITKNNYDNLGAHLSPDGKLITYSSNRSKKPDIDILKNDLFVISINGGKEKLIPTPAGPIEGPKFSSDGKFIAYMGHDNPDDEWGVTNHHIWKVGINGKPKAKDLMPEFDRMTFDQSITDTGDVHEATPLFWSGDSKRIYFLSSDTGSTNLFFVPASGGKPTRIFKGKCHIKGFSVDGKTKKAAIVYADIYNPGDIVISPTVYGGENKSKKLTNLSRFLHNDVKQAKAKEVMFSSFDGTKIQGWMVFPPSFNPNRKYPAILNIHGGPRVQYAHTFFHEMQYFATKGYIVFYTNPRGGAGRGMTWAEAISGGWGELDYKDCCAAADYMEKQKFIKSTKLGVTGGSYGGYMTNWIIGHTNRFAAAVTQRSVVDLRSFFGSSDLGWTLHREFNGTPWNNEENYKQCSPITHFKNVKTPVLIIHSENDLRCHIEQGEQMFAMLKMLNKKVEMVRFPEEPHGLSRHGRPDRRIARLDWIVKWFDKYLK